MKIGKSHRLFYSRIAPPADFPDGSYAAEFGRRHPKGYLLVDHASIQWRLRNGRIRVIHLCRTAAETKRKRP